MPTTRQIFTVGLTAMATTGCLAPAALAQGGAPRRDWRSPDARDAAALAQRSRHGSGDRVVDKRSPDARDVAEGRPVVPSTPVDIVGADRDGSSGFDAGSAAIGAGGALGLLCAGVGGTALVVRRRHRPSGPGRSTSPAH
jgi:hypothetical protein